MRSDYTKPLNVGSDEMVSMNQMADLVMSFAGKELPMRHIPGPEGVRGRNSDNTHIREVLGWAPTIKLQVLHGARNRGAATATRCAQAHRLRARLSDPCWRSRRDSSSHTMRDGTCACAYGGVALGVGVARTGGSRTA